MSSNQMGKKEERISKILRLLPTYCDSLDACHIVNEIKWWYKFKKVNAVVGKRSRYVETL